MQKSYSLLRLAAINSVDLSEFQDVEDVAAALRAIKHAESCLAIHEAMHRRMRKKYLANITAAKQHYETLLERYRPGQSS